LLADRDREAPRRESGALPHRSSEGRERRRDHHALAARLTRAELVASCPSDLVLVNTGPASTYGRTPAAAAAAVAATRPASDRGRRSAPKSLRNSWGDRGLHPRKPRFSFGFRDLHARKFSKAARASRFPCT